MLAVPNDGRVSLVGPQLSPLGSTPDQRINGDRCTLPHALINNLSYLTVKIDPDTHGARSQRNGSIERVDVVVATFFDSYPTTT